MGICASSCGSLTITNGSTVTVMGNGSGCDGAQAVRFGNNGEATLTVSDGATLTINDSNTCDVIYTGSDTDIIIKGGGTVNDTNGGFVTSLRLTCGAILRTDACACNTGVGTWGLGICLDGGTINCGTLAGETLVLSGNITQLTSTDDMVINGAGSVRLGSDDMIDNTSDSIDIDLNGGTLDLNGTSQGTEANSIGELTASNGSTIAMLSSDTTQNLYLKDFNITGTVNVTGFQGPGSGAAGTGSPFSSSSFARCSKP